MRRQLPHPDTGQDQQFTGMEDTIVMIHEDDHFVAILALQLPPPAQRALAGELFVAPDQPGRLGRRRVGLCQAAGEVRARCALGFGRHADLTSLGANHLVDHLGDLVIWCGGHHPGLGLIPQAIGRGDGQHHDHKGQVAVDPRLRLLREPAGQPPELLAVAEQAILDPTAVVVAVHDRPGITDRCVGQVDPLASGLRRPVAPQVDDHGVQDGALRPAQGLPGLDRRAKGVPVPQICDHAHPRHPHLGGGLPPVPAAHRFGALINGRPGLFGQGRGAHGHVRLGNHHEGHAQFVQGVQTGTVDVGAVDDQLTNPAVRGQIRLRLLHQRHQVGRFMLLDLHDPDRQRNQRAQVQQRDQPPTKHQLDDLDLHPLPVAVAFGDSQLPAALKSRRRDHARPVDGDHHLGHEHAKGGQGANRAVEQVLQRRRTDAADGVRQRLRVHQRVFAGGRAQLGPARAQPGRHLVGIEPNQGHGRHVAEQQRRQGVTRGDAEQHPRPIQQHECQHRHQQVAHPGDRQRLPVRFDATGIQKGEKAIQQTGFFQPVAHVDALPAVDGLGDGLIIAFRKLPIQQFGQILLDFGGSLAVLAHLCLLEGLMLPYSATSRAFCQLSANAAQPATCRAVSGQQPHSTIPKLQILPFNYYVTRVIRNSSVITAAGGSRP